MKRSFLAFICLFLCLLAVSAFARDAAFMDPGASGGSNDEAVKVDPKPDIEVGETAINVAKRVSVFFVNQTNTAVKIEKIVINSDANVTAEASANDCQKQGSIDPSSRCSVEVSVTPTTPGAWSVDVLMTHNGAGRITRARLTGRTTGSGSADNKDSGLAVNAKEVKPVDFGEVSVGDGKTVRSTLMVNDSPDPITIYAIDVIEADNGLTKLDQGCAVDMELAPGASCPVTLLWVPRTGGPISTDLIIRHSGKMGFAVIPIRGNAHGTSLAGDDKIGGGVGGGKGGVPLPPSAQDLEREMANKILPVSESAFGHSVSHTASDGILHLIGTVGDRAVFLRPSGDTVIVPTGGTLEMGGKTAKLLVVSAHSADILVDGKRQTLPLEASAMLIAQAAQDAQADAAHDKSNAPPKTALPQSVALSSSDAKK